MQFSARKSILSILLVAVYAITSFSPLVAQPLVRQSEHFTVDFISDLNIDLSNIKVDIYESTLTNYDSMIGSSEYEHAYSNSTLTDSKGSATFSKPSDRFLVMVDLTTLPYDTGVDKELVFYNDISQKSDVRVISAIASIEITGDSSASDFVSVDIFNTYGEPIKANYTITPNTSTRASLLSSTIEASGYITVGSLVEYYEFTVENTGDLIERVASALEANKISKTEALDLYLELWESGYGGECGTPLITTIRGLVDDTAFYNQLSTRQQGAIRLLFTPPSYDSEYPVNPTSSDYFVIRYTYSGAGTPQAILDIYDAFVAAYDLFVNTSTSPFKFNQPKTETVSGKPRYYERVEKRNSTHTIQK